MILCLLANWGEAGASGAAAGLVRDGLVPRVAVEEEKGRVWADVRGLPAARVARACEAWVLEHGGSRVRHGVGRTAVGAWARAWAAGTDAEQRITDQGKGEHEHEHEHEGDGLTAGTDGLRVTGRHTHTHTGERITDQGKGEHEHEHEGDGFTAGRKMSLSPSPSPTLALTPAPALALDYDRSFLAGLPLEVLEADEKLLSLLEGVGVETCGGLAALDREAVEVRFGGEAVRLWRLSRGDDERRLFRPPVREAPQASLDFVDYVVTDPERLLFTANALLTNVCEALTEAGAHTRRLTLALSLANGDRWTRSIGAARATASRTTWLRRVRAELERLTVPDAVTGVMVAAETAEGAGAVQGDLFDAGFATAAAVDDALDRLVEIQGSVLVEPESNGHPLAERRSTFGPVDRAERMRERSPWRGESRGWRRRRDAPEHVPSRDDDRAPLVSADFTLQLLPEPRRVLVETIVRRDHIVPVRYRDGTWRALLTAAGPERVSGGQWEAAYAREYYRCVDGNGLLVWIYRDGREGEWFLHGWWD